MAKKAKSELSDLAITGHDSGDEHQDPETTETPEIPETTEAAPQAAPEDDDGHGAANRAAIAAAESAAPSPSAPALFDPATLATLPVGSFGSAGQIRQELDRLGDPWHRFKTGCIDPVNQARADREAAIREWDRKIAELDEAHRRGRAVVQEELERKRLLEIRLGQIVG